jgi:prepilin-type N-terminal cleavage/methylation domain-containing protein
MRTARNSQGRGPRCTPSGGASASALVSHGRFPSPGFTLIELILVMALLTIAISVTAPALSNFFRGRSLDSEARRLLALTRAGQSRAASEGVPVELWIDQARGSFGLEAEPSYSQQDPKAVEFQLDSDMRIEALNGVPNGGSLAAAQVPPNQNLNGAPVLSRHPELVRIRFLPDGTISESSPQVLLLHGREDATARVTQSYNRMHYEIPARN